MRDIFYYNSVSELFSCLSDGVTKTQQVQTCFFIHLYRSIPVYLKLHVCFQTVIFWTEEVKRCWRWKVKMRWLFVLYGRDFMEQSYRLHFVRSLW